MRLNEATALVGSGILLVPYRKEHVERYHFWMQDPRIQEATASEPLTLEEEYDMQRSWHEDNDKLTFIILARDSANPSETIPQDLRQGMIGDVNLFLSDVDEAENADSERTSERTNTDSANRKKGELEIMIAEPSARRKGYASQALKLMVCYAMQELKLGPEDFLVKIGMANAASIRMFENLGFSIVKRVEVFQEVEMRVITRISHFKWLMDSETLPHVKISIT